jgi:AcrR family transcriptional regulator
MEPADMPKAEAMERPRGRPGRPSRERAGEVDERILDAAREVFLARGFDGASIDEIAQVARAGKPTIYARFPGKEALYAAVVERNVVSNTRPENFTLAGDTFEHRLINLSTALLERALNENTVGLIRVSISEARRFPEFALKVTDMARAHGLEATARLLRELVQRDPAVGHGRLAADQIPMTARTFMELIFYPLLFRALTGEDLGKLRGEIHAHVVERVTFFLAASGHIGTK